MSADYASVKFRSFLTISNDILRLIHCEPIIYIPEVQFRMFRRKNLISCVTFPSFSLFGEARFRKCTHLPPYTPESESVWHHLPCVLLLFKNHESLYVKTIFPQTMNYCTDCARQTLGAVRNSDHVLLSVSKTTVKRRVKFSWAALRTTVREKLIAAGARTPQKELQRSSHRLTIELPNSALAHSNNLEVFSGHQKNNRKSVHSFKIDGLLQENNHTMSPSTQLNQVCWQPLGATKPPI